VDIRTGAADSEIASALRASVGIRPRRMNLSPRTFPRRIAVTPVFDRVAIVLGLAATIVYAFFTLLPTTLGLWPTLLCLLALAPAGAVVHVWSDRASGAGRRLFGPLTLFSLAFVFVLALRAISLALGEEGRFFVLKSQTHAAEPVLAAHLEEDDPERRGAAFPPITTDAAQAGLSDDVFPGTLSVSSADSYLGSAAFVLRFTSGLGGDYVAAELPTPIRGAAAVANAASVVSSLAVQAAQPLPPRTGLDLYVRYFNGTGAFVADRAATGKRARLRNPVANRWYFLEGKSRAPSEAAAASILLVVRTESSGAQYALLADAPLVVSGAPRLYRAIVADASTPNAATRAGAIAIAALAAVFIGYLLPLGGALSRRLPPLSIAALNGARASLAIGTLVGIGLAAYLVEMSLYGGYSGYVDSLREAGTGALGRWYLRTLALLPTGVAVGLLAGRLVSGERRRWRPVEIAAVVIGSLIPASYLLKTTLVLPLLQVLLVLYFVRRRGLAWLTAAAAGIALVTPIVYWVRFYGLSEVAFFASADYWRQFWTNVTSRFFHYESLMITVPIPNSESPWQPLVDLATTAVPRFLWDEKPLSPATRFTREHLMPGLQTGTDVGVISLPGELWLLGGALGLLVGGMAIGVALRFSHALIASRIAEGNLLVAAGLVSGLIFLVDGWGLSSATIEVALVSLGWIVLLRPMRPRGSTSS
jgi:hypothetical protein